MKIGRVIKWLVFITLFLVAFYTRFTHLNWGLPFPFHPDERNMTMAILDMYRSHSFNPHFFAYGQLPLYLVLFTANILKVGLDFNLATIGLRIISAISSLLTIYLSFKIVSLFYEKKNVLETIMIMLIFIFSPVLIQMSHFGTTESLLSLIYTFIIYLSLDFLRNKSEENLFLIAVVGGIGVGIKTSSVFFLLLPVFAIFSFYRDKKRIAYIKSIYLFAVSFLIFILTSPYNFIDFSGFVNSMTYESSVATGKVFVFYTHQFIDSIPYLFQLKKVFPYALGMGSFIFFIVGFFFLSWKNKLINFLRIAFLLYFISFGAMFAKWTRFMAPVFPLTLIFVSLLVLRLYRNTSKILLTLLVLISLIPALGYLHIYNTEDVRQEASRWIYKNIPSGSYILSETANVVDIPYYSEKLRKENIHQKEYTVVSFNFYNLDDDLTGKLKKSLESNLKKSDYVFVPSRRIFANYTCISPDGQRNYSPYFLAYSKSKCDYEENRYPNLNLYYTNLFTGRYGFNKVAKFTRFPTLKIFGKTIYSQDDEYAEETWTVFDHPVVRIYKKY